MFWVNKREYETFNLVHGTKFYKAQRKRLSLTVVNGFVFLR